MSKEYIQALDDLLGLVAFLPRESFKRAQKYFDIIEQALERLESIDNTNPSEAIKELKILYDEIHPIDNIGILDIHFDNIKQYILKAQEQDKVLEIIKEKPQVELSLIQLGKIKTYEEYLKYTDMWESYYWEYEYTEEEFELVKRYFG